MTVTVTVPKKAMSWAIFGFLVAAIGGAAISLQKEVAAQTSVEHTLFVRSALLQLSPPCRMRKPASEGSC